MGDLLEWAKENPVATGAIIAAVVLFLFLLVCMLSGETFVNRTVDMTAWRNPDPTWFKYWGRKRDPAGMDGYDYYFENKMHHKYGLGPELFNEAAFTSRVVSEDTLLKEPEAPSAAMADEPGESTERFVGGMSY
jgi:hypothetical protein